MSASSFPMSVNPWLIAQTPADSGVMSISAGKSAPCTIFPNRWRASSPGTLSSTSASNEHRSRSSRCEYVAPGASKPIAPSRCWIAATSPGSTKRISACGSRNLRISHPVAVRLTWMRLRVIHFIEASLSLVETFRDCFRSSRVLENDLGDRPPTLERRHDADGPIPGVARYGLRDGGAKALLGLGHRLVLRLGRGEVFPFLDLLCLRDLAARVVDDDFPELALARGVEGELELSLVNLELARDRFALLLGRAKPFFERDPCRSERFPIDSRASLLFGPPAARQQKRPNDRGADQNRGFPVHDSSFTFLTWLRPSPERP